MELVIFFMIVILGPLIIFLGWNRDGRTVALLAKYVRICSLWPISLDFSVWYARVLLLAFGGALMFLWIAALVLSLFDAR